MSRISLTRLAQLLTEQGVPALIDGGISISTLHIGTTHHEEGWGDRYQLLAGPGMNERGWGDPWAETGELVIGRDDDGTSPVLWRGAAADTEETVAAVIVTLLAQLGTSYPAAADAHMAAADNTAAVGHSEEQ